MIEKNFSEVNLVGRIIYTRMYVDHRWCGNNYEIIIIYCGLYSNWYTLAHGFVDPGSQVIMKN